MTTPGPLPLWGGVECTVNRVGDRYFDQVERTGHAGRISEIGLVAALGIRTLRYPILWERTAPGGLERAQWGWPDARIAALACHDVAPIVGLIHHGSGPRGTDLLDPAFPRELARYAGAVARRYPSIDAYTPINEPLTTARFSALYGHWYPHHRSDRSFIRALLLECRATGLAMRAIREVNPHARLVQTEDVAATRSTEPLEYQAAFERERRWLTFDLLTGRVTEAHPLWRWLRRGAEEAELLDLLGSEPCPPDVLGINYYVTSERFLDHRLQLYPTCSIGGNGRDRYVDVEAVRACPAGLVGLRALLEETWLRYRTPIAVTEAHIGCSEDEQVSWIEEQWNATLAARASGAEVSGFTMWSLFGAYDWDSLVTRSDGNYEAGVFDVRAGAARPTALAGLARRLARGEVSTPQPQPPTGWWRMPERLLMRCR